MSEETKNTNTGEQSTNSTPEANGDMAARRCSRRKM